MAHAGRTTSNGPIGGAPARLDESRMDEEAIFGWPSSVHNTSRAARSMHDSAGRGGSHHIRRQNHGYVISWHTSLRRG